MEQTTPVFSACYGPRVRRILLPVVSVLACTPAPDLDECEGLALAACDIREEACQDHYSAVLRCVREDDQPTPKLEVIGADEYRERFTDEDEPAALTAVDRAFVLLGLLGPAGPAGEIQVPSARYDFASRTVIVVDTGDRRAQLRAISQAHADAAVDFLALDAEITSEDQRIAALALFFGETIFYGDAAYFKLAETREDFRARLAANLYYGNEVADAAYVARLPEYDHLAVSTAFAVGFGADAVISAWLGDGPAAVRAGYDPLVISAGQIVAHALGAPPDLVEPDPPVLPEGLELVARDRLGPWLLHTLQTRAAELPEDTSLSYDLERIGLAVENWRGDALFVVADAEADAVGLVLTVALAERGAWTPADGDWQVAADGLTATLVLAETAEIQDALTAAVASGTRSRASVQRRGSAALRERRPAK